MAGLKRKFKKGHAFTSKCATLVKKQRARLYILSRCATMLCCCFWGSSSSVSSGFREGREKKREVGKDDGRVVVGLEPSFIHGNTDTSDTLALNNMFRSMGSPGQLSQWTVSGGDPCGQNWKGITCSGSRVTQIKLSGLGLSGYLGYMLDKLTFVTEFDLSNNNLEGDLPYMLPPNLERLNLANNQFTGFAQYSISMMTPLNNLSQNQLKQLAIDFTKLTSLSVLDLSSNGITGSLPDSCSSLTSIKSIYLQNNQFSGTIDVLAGLPLLENLNIANNRFTGWIPDSLKGINLQKDGNLFNSLS